MPTDFSNDPEFAFLCAAELFWLQVLLLHCGVARLLWGERGAVFWGETGPQSSSNTQHLLCVVSLFVFAS